MIKVTGDALDGNPTLRRAQQGNDDNKRASIPLADHRQYDEIGISRPIFGKNAVGFDNLGICVFDAPHFFLGPELRLFDSVLHGLGHFAH